MVVEWKWETAVPELSPITEGPAWDGRYLWFVYTAIDGIMRFDPETGEYSVGYYQSNGCGGLTFDSEGRLYGAEGGTRPPLIDHSAIRRIARYEKDGSRTTITDRLKGRRLNGPNDVIVDSKGRVWFSDPVSDVSEVPRRLGPNTKPQQLTHSSLLRADPQPDGSYVCSRATFDMTGPNGMVFSKDEKTLYATQLDYTGYARRELRSYPVNDDGSLGPAHRTARLRPSPRYRRHVPHDGRQYRGSRRLGVHGSRRDDLHLRSKGRILETHPTPSARPTNACFAGPDMTETVRDQHPGDRRPCQGYRTPGLHALPLIR